MKLVNRNPDQLKIRTINGRKPILYFRFRMAEALITFSLLCITKEAASAGVMFNTQSLPADNWFELPKLGSEEGMLKSRSSCISACILRGDECHGFELHEDDTCTLGKLQASGDNNSYIPEYVMTGKKVYLRSGKVIRKAVTGVTHLASIRAGKTYDAAFEDTRFGPLALPPPLASGRAIIATNYNRGFLSCAGKDENGEYSKKCR